VANRGAYVAAALTVIRAYRVAGSPPVCGAIGSYEDWSDMVRSPLVWLGHADPVESMETAREEDPELSAIRELFEHWRSHLHLSSGYTTNTIIRTACDRDAGNHFAGPGEFKLAEFRDLLLRQAGDGGAVNSRRLGKWLPRIKGRVVDGHRIEMKADASNGNRFSLCQVSGTDHFPGERVAPDYRASSAPEF
jgi:putative DNA primase/helicase